MPCLAQMIKRAKEGAVTWFPDLRLEDIPAQIPSGVSLHVKSGTLGIEAQGVVGALKLANGETLHILPKIGDVNFFHLLFKAEGLQDKFWQEANNFASYFTSNDQTFSTIVSRSLLFSIDEILRRSALGGRSKIDKRGTFAAGSLNVINTILNIHSKKSEPICYSINQRTFDIPENRILTEAAIFAMAFLSNDEKPKFKTIYLEWIKRFPRSNNISDDLNSIAQNMASNKYGGPRDYYRRALVLAQILFGYSGYGLSGVTSFFGDAILLNTANVFEKFVRKTIASEYISKGLLVSKGTDSVYSLYTDGSYTICPDVMMADGKNILLIVDAKYKKPTIDDHYQINTYLSVLGLSKGILIAPEFEGDNVEVKEFLTPDRKVVIEAYIPMQHLEVAENYLRNIL